MWISRTGIIASSGGSMDVDAQAFITAATITDNTQKSAVNQLVKDLKSANVWTKMKAVYPFVGGTAFTHKWNLKDPRDLDYSFRLVFSGGGTHSATGYLPNGTTSYADTKLVPRDNVLSADFNHLSYYSRTNTAKIDEYVMGVYDGTGSLSMIARRDTNAQRFYSDVLGSSYRGAADILSTDSRAFYIGTQQGANIKLFRNTTLAVSNTNAANGNDTPTVYPIYIGSLNFQNNPNGYYTNKECAFASVGKGLSDAEALAFYNAVQAYQTALSRNV